MYKKFTLLLTALFPFVGAKATYIPIVLSGFNTDVVANGVGLPSTTTTGALDDASPTTGFVFIAEDYQNSGSCPTPTAPYYLPNSGLIVHPTIPALTWQLENYSLDNAMRITNTNLSPSTVMFNTPTAAGEVYMLAVSGQGAAPVNVSVNFTDNTTQTYSLTIADWYGGSPYILQAGRVSRTSLTCTYDGSASLTGPRLYQYTLAISPANQAKLIAGITITKTSTTGHVNLMAVTVNTPCAIPSDQPTSLNLVAGSSQITGSFNSALSNPDGYLVVRYASGATPVSPVNATTYTVGSSLGTGYVVHNGPATSFVASGLFANTTYDFYVYALNSLCAGGPIYNTVSPLFGSQTTPACGGPANMTIPVGPGQTYTNLTAALNSLTSTGISGPVILELQNNYDAFNEPAFPIVFPFNSCISPTNTLTVRPAVNAPGLMISGSNSGPTLDFNSAGNIIVDGRPGGVGTFSPSASLKIINTSNAGAAIRFINDASFNTIQYCDLQGQNPSYTTSALSGVVYFSTASSTGLLGNDNNSILHCDIHGTSFATTPAIGIVSYGTNSNPAAYNDNCTIDNCNIYDFFSASIQSAGIKLDQGNSSWTVSNNSLYQTVPRVYTTANSHRGMHINSNSTGSSTMTPQGSGFNIIGNYIGGSAQFAGGAPMDLSGGTLTNTFMGMDVSVGVGAPTLVKNNVVQNIAFSTANANTTTPNFTGIHGNYGNLNINNNKIGDTSLATQLTLTRTGTTTTAGLFAGLRIAGGITNTIDSNIIGGITTIGSGTIPYSIVGIYVTNGTNNNISSNIIGSYTGLNTVNASTTGGTQLVYGIWVTGGTNTTISQNVISNINNSGTGTAARIIGINVTASVPTISSNTIRNLSTSSANTGTDGSSAAIGINLTSGSGPFNISGNIVSDFVLSNTAAATSMAGLIVNAATSGTNSVARNFIYRLASLSTSASSVVSGIVVSGGAATYANNMIALGFDPQNLSIPEALVFRGIVKNGTAPNNFYFNSVYLGGTVFSAGSSKTFAFQRNNTSGTDAIKNNIFVNARSNGASASSHYAISFGTNTGTGGNVTGVDLNYNVYHTPGLGGIIGYNTTDILSYSPGWVIGDNNSISADPQFVNPTAVGGGGGLPDLHISPSVATPVESAGTPISGILDDFDGDVRANVTPTDIGADAAVFLNSPLAIRLLSFRGENSGTSNRLFWQTGEEELGDAFELERGIDGMNYTPLTTLQARGTASSYSFIDSEIPSGVTFYRLRMKDVSGRSMESRVVKMNTVDASAFSLIAFPNPVNDKVMLQMTNRGIDAVLTITDLTGTLLSVRPVSENFVLLDMSGFIPGTYFVRYSDGSNTKAIKLHKH